MRSRLRWIVATVLVWSTAAVGAVLLVPPTAGATAIPESVTVSGVPAVGTLFTLNKNGTLGSHFCTASVVASPAGDLVLTAAHCVSHRSPGSFVFVPNYHDGTSPYGIWSVTKVAVDRAWSTSASPNDDFAFLLVRQAGNAKAIQAVTGAERLGINLPPGQLLKVVGYPDSKNAPISCENLMVLFNSSQLEFDCAGYADGTSGSPLVVNFNPATGTGVVVGVIGGFELGGYTPSVSYAARFETNMTALYDEVVSP